jgi:hypothetical protein
LNHGCSVISLTGIRCLGSIFKSLDIKSFAIPENPFGHLIFNASILLNKSLYDFPSNGGLPVNNSKRSTPKFQTSRVLSCPDYLIISGAKYSGVPQ